jgi:putative transcriptional regulator
MTFSKSTPVSEELKALRASLKMSQRQFSETFGFALASVQTWESPAKNGNPDTAARLLLDMIKLDATSVANLVRKVKIARLNIEEHKPA